MTILSFHGVAIAYISNTMAADDNVALWHK